MIGAAANNLKADAMSQKTFSGLRDVRGFTLLEILVVVTIIAIMAGVVVVNVMGRPGEARQARAQQDIQAIVTALSIYKLDNFSYPSTEQGLDALVHKPAGAPEASNWKPGGYLEKLSKDPWSQPYLYVNPGQHGAIDVYSLGSDRKPGGDGEEKDIGNWEN
jgi:general secretion pathway protein G